MVKNVDGFDVNSINEKSPIGYLLEADLEYPGKLHELHNDYPLLICCHSNVKALLISMK